MEQNWILFDIHWIWQLLSLFNQLLISIFHLSVLFLNYRQVKDQQLFSTLGFNQNKPNGVYQSHPIPQSSFHCTLNNNCSNVADEFLWDNFSFLFTYDHKNHISLQMILPSLACDFLSQFHVWRNWEEIRK